MTSRNTQRACHLVLVTDDFVPDEPAPSASSPERPYHWPATRFAIRILWRLLLRLSR